MHKHWPDTGHRFKWQHSGKRKIMLASPKLHFDLDQLTAIASAAAESRQGNRAHG